MPNLSFFKFSPEQWLTGKIQLLSAVEKGIYIDLAARIWQAGGSIENSPVLHRVLRVEKGTLCEAFQAFFELGILQIDGGCLRMKFITEQLAVINEYSKRQAEYGKTGGRPKGNPFEEKGNPLQNEGNPKGTPSEKKGSKGYKDKDIDKDNIREKENILKEKVSLLFNRRPTTPWSDKETKQLREVSKRPEAIQELAAIEALYGSGYIYRRRDIMTLLNNWTVELDRAQARGMGAPGNDVKFTESERNDNEDRF